MFCLLKYDFVYFFFTEERASTFRKQIYIIIIIISRHEHINNVLFYGVIFVLLF